MEKTEETQNSTKTSFKGVFILLMTALIWGTSFLAQRFGTDSGVEPFTFQGIRTLMGAMVLVPFILIRDKASAKSMTEQQLAERKKTNKKAVIYGSIVGVVLCAATNLQQWAFVVEPSAGKIAFITAMYMFFVPIFGLFFTFTDTPGRASPNSSTTRPCRTIVLLLPGFCEVLTLLRSSSFTFTVTK